MKKKLLILLTGGILLSACKQKHSNNEQVRIVFDAGNLKFIASSLNPKQETMSALYGNDIANRLLSAGDSLPQPGGAVIKLVTWRLHDDPQYFGSSINGELLSVETVSIAADDTPSYRLDHGSLPQPVQQDERIRYIMGYKPVQFP